MKQFLSALLAFICYTAMAARADDSDAFLQRIETLHSLKGSFTQEQRVPGSDEVLRSSGRFRLLRPGYFAWEIQAPDSQLIIASPDTLWHYDRDLETVTRREVGSGGQMTPLQVLGGDAEALRSNYTVEHSEEGAFKLTPRASEAGFRSVVLRFGDITLEGMSIVDSLGQAIEVRFSQLEHNPALSAGDFEFSPPPEADIFYQ